MGESFFENIGYVIVFLIFVLPRLLKFLAKRRGSTTPNKAAKKTVAKQPQAKPVVFTKQILNEMELIEEDEPIIGASELKDLETEAKSLLVRAEEILNLSKIRSEEALKLSPEIEAVVVTPLRALVSRLENLADTSGFLDWTEGERIRAALDKKRGQTSLFQSMVDMRTSPQTEEIVGLMDTAAKGVLEPYLNHTLRMRVPFSTRFAATLLGEPDEDAALLLEGERVAPVFIRERSASTPRAWVNIASDVYLDVFHSTNGLKRKVITDLGVLPAPMSLSHYGDQRAFVAGLLGGWLPRIFADCCAALLLGPAFASGLSKWLGKELDEYSALLARIGNHEGRATAPPLYLRMFVALRVLGHLDFGDEAKTLFENWNQQLANPDTFVIEEAGGRQASAPIQPILQATGRIVDYFVTESNSTLGNFALTEIPGLACDKQRWARMDEVALCLLDGQIVDDPGYIVIGAAQLAFERSNTLEQRIVAASFGSLKRDGVSFIGTPKRQEAGGGLYSNLKSRDFLAGAIVAGAALAPRTARFNASRRN